MGKESTCPSVVVRCSCTDSGRSRLCSSRHFGSATISTSLSRATVRFASATSKYRLLTVAKFWKGESSRFNNDAEMDGQTTTGINAKQIASPAIPQRLRVVVRSKTSDGTACLMRLETCFCKWRLITSDPASAFVASGPSIEINVAKLS